MQSSIDAKILKNISKSVKSQFKRKIMKVARKK